jgi:hypothetical protein
MELSYYFPRLQLIYSEKADIDNFHPSHWFLTHPSPHPRWRHNMEIIISFFHHLCIFEKPDVRPKGISLLSCIYLYDNQQICLFNNRRIVKTKMKPLIEANKHKNLPLGEATSPGKEVNKTY